jgi:hypothetical protein
LQLLNQVEGVIADAGERGDKRFGVEQKLHEVGLTWLRQSASKSRNGDERRPAARRRVYQSVGITP